MNDGHRHESMNRDSQLVMRFRKSRNCLLALGISILASGALSILGPEDLIDSRWARIGDTILFSLVFLFQAGQQESLIAIVRSLPQTDPKSIATDNRKSMVSPEPAGLKGQP